MEIFKVSNKDMIILDVKTLIEHQNNIIEKFPNPLEDGKFIYLFDNMVAQINEEIYELNEEIIKCLYDVGNESDSMIEEACDVLMYIGSTICQIKKYFDLPDTSIISNILLTKSSINLKHEGEYQIINITEINSARRLIYDRKYHKPNTKKIDNYEIKLISEILFRLFNPSTIYNFSNFLNQYFYSYVDVNRNNDPLYEKYKLEYLKSRVDRFNKILTNKYNTIINL